MADGPPSQSSIDLWKTFTLNQFHIDQNAYVSMSDMRSYVADGPPKSIEHRSLEDHYPWQIDPIPPPAIKHRSLENHYTKSVSYRPKCTSTQVRSELICGRWTPQSIEHRSLEDHYPWQIDPLLPFS